MRGFKVFNFAISLLVGVPLMVVIVSFFLVTNGGANIGAGVAFFIGPVLWGIIALLWLIYFARLRPVSVKSEQPPRLLEIMRYVGLGALAFAVVCAIYGYAQLYQTSPNIKPIIYWEFLALGIIAYWLVYHLVKRQVLGKQCK
ncbi:hypothetical protein HMPREF0044_1156 [Gleimia coleocanis DSM 15436]|uniref:Uncharacterized protein n=1 Tax=Gleimia coleocanis DSM 15436 TaxID=525245 RepID=C0W166_9ACTO|nr:hypothetical protein [Gleimia coleocanis]EEH63555.1 hypothetical protein HMPREF0044_1156 [Gleimia coleocanis DSM 15436]